MPHAFALPLTLAFMLAAPCMAAHGAEENSGEKEELRILVFGAHPDDAEINAGATAALWSDQGHHVKFVSLTNGDIGHAEMAGGELARRRQSEVEKAADVLGIEETEVLDIHDGELMPTLENRKKVVRLIREWEADVVIHHRPNDYHPDHRYAGILVQDAAFMVIVKHFLPTVPQLAENPVFLYMEDGFQKPSPFEPDVIVGIDRVIDRKVDALWQMESQIESFWATGDFEEVIPVPEDSEERAERKRDLAERFKSRNRRTADKYREHLIERYGSDEGRQIEFAEAFELCEYGTQPSPEALRELFPSSRASDEE